MSIKNDTKNYLRFNIITFLILFFLSYSTVFVQKVNADFENTLAQNVYNTAWNIINDKFYFKSNLNLSRWQNKFKNKIDSLEESHKCINKLLQALDDPYTRFLSKEEFKDEQDIISSNFTGIGIKLSVQEPIILDVLEESPASKEGIKLNDYLLSVNNKSTRNLKTDQIVNLLRGPKGTALTINIKRGNKIITKNLQREELTFNAVSTKILEDDIPVIKISSFIPENTSKSFKDEILKLMSANGLVVDLRNNSGGLMKNAIEIADMFLSEGRIVSTSNGLTKTNNFANSSTIFDGAVVILVNENTASASEIFASALKENKRAILIGKKTFGKGLVQEIIQLPDESALHVTVAAYFTPSGKNINKVGIVPDEIIVNEEKQIERAKEILLNASSPVILL